MISIWQNVDCLHKTWLLNKIFITKLNVHVAFVDLVFLLILTMNFPLSLNVQIVVITKRNSAAYLYRKNYWSKPSTLGLFSLIVWEIRCNLINYVFFFPKKPLSTGIFLNCNSTLLYIYDPSMIMRNYIIQDFRDLLNRFGPLKGQQRIANTKRG